MKAIKKILALSLATAGLLLGFASCDDDDDDDVSTVAVFKSAEYDDDGAKAVDTVTFYDDKTFEIHYDAKEVADGFTIVWSMTSVKGTYEGNPAADGEVKITCKKWVDDSETTEDAAIKKVLAAAESGKTTITLTNEDFPLVDAEDGATDTVTVSGGKYTDEDEGLVYTRQ